MTSNESNLRDTITRHEREIATLKEQVRALHDGHAREQLESQIARRLAELQADIDLQALQEKMAREEAEKQQKRRLFRKRRQSTQ